MPAISTQLSALGNTGMTKFGTNNDDATVNIAMGITMKYGGADVTTIYTSGNSWVGFGSSTQHLNINNKDESYNALYYSTETMYGQICFRLRFEGNTGYNSWGANNLVWELICFPDGGMTLIIERNDGGGTSNFDSKGNGVISYGCETGKSYALTPALSSEGINYSILEGQYVPVITKYLVQDGNEIKAYDKLEGQFKKVGNIPATSKMFRDFGNDKPNESRIGVIEKEPKLLIWCDFASIYDTVPFPKLYQKGLAHPKLVKMVKDEFFDEAYILGIVKATVQIICDGESTLKFILSENGGTTWKSWYNNAWVSLDINNIQDVKDRGMTKATLEAITESQWTSLGLSNKKIRFAWYMEQVNLSSPVIVRQIKLDYKTQGV